MRNLICNTDTSILWNQYKLIYGTDVRVEYIPLFKGYTEQLITKIIGRLQYQISVNTATNVSKETKTKIEIEVNMPIFFL